MSVDFCDPLKTMTLLRTISSEMTQSLCVTSLKRRVKASAADTCAFTMSTVWELPKPTPYSHIFYSAENPYKAAEGEVFPCTWSFRATFTRQKGRKSHQPHPGMLRFGKVLIKQSSQSSVNSVNLPLSLG